MIRNAANVQQGGFHAYYTGRMTGLEHSADENGQTITVTIESYLAVFSEASNRTYLSQDQFDSGDRNPRAAVAIANGNYTGAVTGSGYSGQSGVGVAVGPTGTAASMWTSYDSPPARLGAPPPTSSPSPSRLSGVRWTARCSLVPQSRR